MESRENEFSNDCKIMNEIPHELEMEEQVRELLAENNARLRDGRVYYLFKNEVLVRIFHGFRKEYINAAVEFLNRYVSVENFTQDRTPSTSVTNPLVDGLPRKGIFRPVYVGYEKGEFEGVERYMIVQVLATGNLFQNFEIVEKSCRYRVSWKWYFSSASIPALPENSPGITYKFAQLRESRDFGGWDAVIEKREQLEQQQAYTSETSPARSVETTETEGKREGPSSIEPEQGKIKRQSFSMNENCTGNEKLDVIQPKDQARSTREESPSRTVEEELHTEASEPLAAPTEEQGKIKVNSNTPTEAGNTRTVARVETPKDQTRSTREESLSRTVEEELHTEASEPLGIPAAEQGKIKVNSNTPTEAGNTRTVARVETPKDQTRSTREESPSRTVEEELHTEAAEPLAAPTEEQGKIKVNSNTPTEAGNTRTVARVETPKDQTRTTKTESLSRSVTEELHTEAADPLGSPEAEQGKIKVNSNTPTEAGNTRTVARVETPKDQTRITREESPSRSVKEELHTEASSPLDAPESETGKIKVNSNTPTEAGNTRTVARVETPKDQARTSKEVSALSTVTEELHTEASIPLADPQNESGKVKKVSNTPTEAGNTRTVSTEDEAIPMDSGWVSYADDGGINYVRVFKNQDQILVDGLSTDTRNQVSPSINRYGLYDGIAFRRSSDQSSGSGSSPWDNYTKVVTIPRWETSFIQGTRSRRLVQYTVGILQTTNQNEAYNFIDGKENGKVDVIRGGTRFRSTYAILKVSDIGPWESDE